MSDVLMDRVCRYCGYRYDGATTYGGKPRKPSFKGRVRGWCTPMCRQRNYTFRRRERLQQRLLREYYVRLEEAGQQRFPWT